MSNDHRITSLSITPTMSRQTPKTDFGTVLARTAHEIVRSGSGLVGGMIPGGPVMSAAISSISSTVSSVASSASGVTSVPGAGVGSAVTTGGAASTGATAGRGEQWELLEAQQLMQAEGQKFNMAYLDLQNAMQRESREHNTISNIMKVRHDSAKAAINNIR